MADLNLYDPLEFDPHALRRMTLRKITHDDVLQALHNYHTRHDARPRPGVPIVSHVYVGVVGGRNLRVWVAPNSNPVYVLSVAWQGEDD